MLTADAYVFLNISHPLCAWNTYRSVLVCAEDKPGFLSVWSAQLLRGDEPARIILEQSLEAVRREYFNERISRLRGLFCFLDLASAERACKWATNPRSHFRPEYLAELHLEPTTTRRDKLDANWISYASEFSSSHGHLPENDWAKNYWGGEPYPNFEPVWETLVDGRAAVLGTELRARAYDIIKRAFPESLMFLEISRMAAVVESDLGNIFAFLQNEGSDLILKYLQDMRDAEDPVFLARLEALKASGHPINWADMQPHIANDSFGRVMDLRTFGFRRSTRQDVPMSKKSISKSPMKSGPKPSKPSISPSAHIDARIKELGDWRGEMLARVRAIIKQADPDVIEEWKWRGVPVWEHDGIICTGETYKAAVKLTFAKGASLDDPSKLFNASLEGNMRRAIDIREGDKINATALKTLIRAAVALNAAKHVKKPVKKK